MDTITSRTNERVKAAALLGTDASSRRSEGLCLVDGIKLCREASSRGLLREIWFTEDALRRLGGEPERLAGRAVLMSPHVGEKLSYQREPSGVVGIASIPRSPELGFLSDKRRAVVLWGIQDPANVGALLRSAAALGFDGAVLCEGCADPFSPRALRASMGAAFALPLIFAGGRQTVAALRLFGCSTVAAALERTAVPIEDVDKTGALALFIGSEGRGLPPEAVAACDVTAYIPISDAVESLNAASAAAIAMWVVTR